MRILLISALFSLAMLTACNSASMNDEATTAGVVKPAAEEPQPLQTEPQGPIWLEPAALEECGKPSVLTVHWDAGSFPGVKAINIMALKPDGSESLFLTAGLRGARETGPWMRAGSQMVLRNKTDDVELGRVAVGSTPCD